MPVLTVKGTYRNGTVELAEAPPGVQEAEVFVTFVPEEQDAGAPPRPLGDEAARARREAAERMFARMERGIDFGGGKFDRAEIYEERMRELDERRARNG